MGSESNCNNTQNNNDYYTNEDVSSSRQSTATSQYYNVHSDNSVKNNINNSWNTLQDGSEIRQNQEMNEQMIRNNNDKSKNYSQTQLQQQPQQWSFPGNSYQRFYNDNYGIILSSNSSQQHNESIMPSSSSTVVENQSYLSSHQMQTQHLKRVYYQGLHVTKLFYPYPYYFLIFIFLLQIQIVSVPIGHFKKF
ncbi:hypothetical protein PVAND_011408 [Polypedilum vanderplanki]|uniref:Uncharacterized protein n=1 Tax=Polypedilum vanderplanki TaxID=319348 RepID=A0A9J6CKB3_POLVA|nr:hypothetical protein PVAND_011408 [Polypedilum vanderplanki]